MSVQSSPPPRPRTYLPADDRRRQILAAAKTVFVKRGYHRANLAHVCAAARIARGTLYVYFENKRALLLQLLEEVAERIEDVLARRPRVEDLQLDPTRLTERAIIGFCEHRLREILQTIFVDEPTLRLVLREARGLDLVVDRVIARIDEGVLTALENDLAQAQRLGILRPGDPRLLARYSLGGIEKIILMGLARDEPLDLDEVVRQTVRLQLFGLLSDNLEMRGGPR